MSVIEMLSPSNEQAPAYRRGREGASRKVAMWFRNLGVVSKVLEVFWCLSGLTMAAAYLSRVVLRHLTEKALTSI